MAYIAPMNRVYFTDDDDQLLRDNYKTHTDEELSAMLGTLPNGKPRHSALSVRYRLSTALLLSRSVKLSTHTSEIAQMARKGANAAELAERFGVTERRIRDFCNKNRIRLVYKKKEE